MAPSKSDTRVRVDRVQEDSQSVCSLLGVKTVYQVGLQKQNQMGGWVNLSIWVGDVFVLVAYPTAR